MGGKTKQSQRTKNNVRPSSSGRSALLLNNVKFDSGLGFGGSEQPALFPTLVVPTIDPTVSPELQLCFKKLNKKDPITKTKALQELTELVTSSNVEEVVAALPSWAHFYKILTADPDRKVREATQMCHGRVVGRCGRRVAPQLRRVVPAWLQAQHDDHAPAHTLAVLSLAKTFPDSKLPEVISFCKEEVMTHFIENLIGPGETAYIRNSDSAEEVAATRARVAASSMHGLHYTCAHLPAMHDAWLWDALQPLLAHKSLWLHPQHSHDHVRAAWYAVMGGVVQRFGDQFAERYGTKMLRVVLGAKETSPAVAAHLWDALLLFISNVKDWPKYLDKKELLNKRIFDVLENGGWGAARRLARVLLPLLARLPAALSARPFHLAFFDAMLAGLLKKSILTSKSERHWWITSLEECLRYLSTQERDYAVEVVSSVHRRWLEAVLSPAHDVLLGNDLIEFSAGRMSALVEYWCRRAMETDGAKYDRMIGNFWQNVGATATSQIDELSSHPDDVERTNRGHIVLLQTLKSSFAREARKRPSVKFDDDVSLDPAPPTTQSTPCDPSIVARYDHNLNEAVHDICGHYFEFASRYRISEPVLSPLLSLVREFNSVALLESIGGRFSCGSVYEWYDTVLRSWLAGDCMGTQAAVDLVFLATEHMTEEQRDAVFDSFDQFPPAVVERCLRASLSHARGGRAWARGAGAGACVAALCARVLARGDAAAQRLLLAALARGADGELPVSLSAAQAAVRRLCAACAACAAGERAPAAALRTCAALCAAPPDPVAAGDLAAALFAYTVATPMPRDEAEAATWRECSAAWQQAAATLSATATQQLLREAALTLHTHLNLRSNLIKKSTVSETPENDENGGPEALQPGRMRHAVAQCAGLVRADTPPHARTLALSRHVLALAPAVRVEPFALRHDLVTSRLSCPCEDDDVTAAIGDDVTELDVRAYVEYARAAVFEAMYLRRILLLEPGRCDELLCDEYMVDRLCGVIYRHMVVCSLWEGYAFWPHYKLIEETKTTMDESLEAIIDECTIQIKGRLLNVLTERAESKGYYWAFARKYFEHKGKLKTEHTSGSGTHEENVESDKSVENENSESETNKETDDVGNFDVENISDIVTKNGFFHILQANVKGLGPADTLRARFVCMVRAVHVAHAAHAAHETDARFLTDTVRCWPDAGADVIVNAYYACNRIMLYDMDVSRSAWRTVCSNTATVQYLCALVDARGWDLPAHHWDFTTITLCSLLCSIDKSKEHWASTKVGMLARAALRLYRAVAVFVRALPAASSRRQPARHVAQLAAEWKDIFAPDTNHNLFSILLYILETVPATSTVTSTHVAVLHELVQCAAHLEWHLVPAGHRRSLSLDRLVSAACDVLRRPVPLAYKCLACAALRAIHEPLVLDDAERVAERTESSPPPALSLQRYAATYRALQDAVQAALAHVPVCESWCSLDAHSEVGGLALGWLLLARAVLQQCELARKDLHHHYIELYRELNYCEPVLVCALRLLPEDVFVFARDGGHGPAPRAEHLFNNEPDLDLYKHADAASVSAAACASVRAAVCGAGVTQARGWRAAAPHRHGNMLDTLVTTYISPYVIEEEFATLQRRAGELEDIDLYIRRSTRSVACVLTLEERALELGVTLARAHPLAPPALRAAAGPEPHTGWLAVYLAHQNGTLLNALKMWRGAVTSKVERSPQCYICYCRLHFQTGRLPQAYCRQCRNKFHTPCLRKWFNTSNKSNCPLCRTAF